MRETRVIVNLMVMSKIALPPQRNVGITTNDEEEDEERENIYLLFIPLRWLSYKEGIARISQINW